MKRLKSQSGFSLVELMVVVAIIGILATLSVGAIQKQIAKTRQSEAKTNLSSLFGAEKGFMSEFQTYHSGFNVIKFGVEGNLRYNVGFSATDGVDLAANGYTSADDDTNFATNVVCVAGASCLALAQATAADALQGTSIVAAGATATSFVAEAATDSLYKANDDKWTMDQNKTLTNTVDGITD